MANIYETDLPQNSANYEALSPLSYLKRSATLYPEYPAIVHGDLVQNWGETYQRCIKFASALSKAGIGKGDTVAVMLPNIPEMFELHFVGEDKVRVLCWWYVCVCVCVCLYYALVVGIY